MMRYPYPELTFQLQFLCSPDEYRRITEVERYWNTPEYWAVTPEYLYAYCPMCGQVYREKADLYTLTGSYTGLAPNLYAEGETGEAEQAKHCAHFLGIRKFINLHGIEPLEKRYFENRSGEVPYVDRHYFLDGMKAFVILHALPICRIMNDAFVPSYTVFTMTYFSEAPAQVIEHIYAKQSIYFDHDDEYYPTLVNPPIPLPESAKEDPFDLAKWADHFRLGWLDFTSPDLPLVMGQGDRLPHIYRAIEGRRERYIWRRPGQA